MPAFVIFASQIVNIRQKELFNQLTRINNQLQTNNQILKSQSQTFSFLKNYLHINRFLAVLMTDIENCANYYSSVLSVYFVGFITIQCYLAYIVFFVPNLIFLVKLFVFYSLVLVETFQFALIQSLCKLTTCNGKLEKANAKFYLLLNRNQSFKMMISFVLKVTVLTFV